MRKADDASFSELLASEDRTRLLAEREAQRNGFTVELLASRAFDFALVYSEWIDDMAHFHWNFFSDGEFLLTDLPDGWSDEEWERSVVEHRAEPAIEAFLRMDELVGRLRARFDADFIVVSDHGWSFDGHLHYGSPDGVVILSGPSFRAGVDLKDVRIEDVAPTVLAALGLPVSNELAGDVLAAAFRGAPSVAAVETYGEPMRASADDEGAADHQLERLRALGYVQ